MSGETMTAEAVSTTALDKVGQAGRLVGKRIAGDTVFKATAHMEEKPRMAIRWLHSFYADENATLDEVGALFKVSGSTISRLMNNAGGDVENQEDLIDQILRYKKLVEERSKAHRLDFVETGLSRQIFMVCDLSRENQRISFIYGDTQIGKSESLLRYTKTHNHGSTIYVRMPTNGSWHLMLNTLAKALRIPERCTQQVLVRRVIESIDHTMLIIVDECHQACYKASGIRSIEFIREIYDIAKCGVVLCGTSVFEQAFDPNKGQFSGILKQIARRQYITLKCPDVPEEDDANEFARQYHLPPAMGEALRLQRAILKEQGLGMWLVMLRMASKKATVTKRKMSWQLVIETHAGLLQLAGKKA